MEGSAIVLDYARNHVAIAILLQLIVQISLGVANVPVELGIVPIVVLRWCHLLGSVGVGQLPVHRLSLTIPVQVLGGLRTIVAIQ